MGMATRFRAHQRARLERTARAAARTAGVVLRPVLATVRYLAALLWGALMVLTWPARRTAERLLSTSARRWAACTTLLAVASTAGAAYAAAQLGAPPAPPSPAPVVAAVAPPTAAAVASSTAAPTQLAVPAAAPEPAARPDAAYYRRTAREHVAATATTFVPLYKEAERTFGVSWRLIASVHKQETAFSTEPSTYRGLNAFGCCAGPMQFNVKNGPVTTWKAYRSSFKQGTRPAAYPHRTAFHPSVYDDFDAIMAAGALLRDSGATLALDGPSWLAAYAYYGHDDFGVTYADQVLARAQGWAASGFCLNCALEATRVAALEDAYGVHEREALAGAAQVAAKEKRERARAKKRASAARRKSAAAKRARATGAAPAKAAKPAPRRPSTPARTTSTASTPAPATPVPATTTQSAPPPSAATGPTGPACMPVMGLVGCG